jgi:hypothetical protein
MPVQEVSHFMLAVHQQLARDYIEEHCRCLEVLILLSYSRRSLSLQELGELMIKFTSQSLDVRSNTALQYLLENSPRSDVAAVEEMLQKVTFRYTVLFAGSFQFWRCFQADAQAMYRHPLLEPTAPDYSQPAARDGPSADSILEALQNVTDVLQKCVAPPAPPLLLRRSESGGSEPFNALTLMDSKKQQPPGPAQRLAVGLWAAFLEAFAAHSIVGAEFVATPAYPKFRSAAAQWAFVPVLQQVVASSLSARGAVAQLAHAFSGSESDASSLSLLASDPNTFIFCSVLQELTNVVIAQHTMRDPTALTELGAVTSLVELTYRGQAGLCSAFWAAWQEAPSAAATGGDSPLPPDGNMTPHGYPLCRLVHTLLESTPHDPSYLYRILVAVAGSAEARMAVLEILNDPGSLITQVPQSQLQFRSEAGLRFDATRTGARDAAQWDSAKTWLRENDPEAMPGVQVRKVEAGNHSASPRDESWWSRSSGSNQANTSAPTAVYVPQEGEAGIVLEYTEDQEVCLVRWDAQRLWWELVIDSVVHFAASGVSPSTEVLANTEPVMRLLAALLGDRQQAQVVAYFLETKWNEIALHSLLRSAGAAECFPELSRRNVRLSAMRADPAAAVDMLIYDLGMCQSDAEAVVTKLRTAAHVEDTLFSPPFADILARATAQLLRTGFGNAPHTASASARFVVLGLQLHVVSCQISSTWNTAQCQMAATSAAPGSGKGSTTMGLYEALLNASTQRHLQPVLPEILLLMAQHVKSHCHSADSLSGLLLPRILSLFDELTSSRARLSAEELAVGLANRGVCVSESMIVDYLHELGLSVGGDIGYAEFTALLLGLDVRSLDRSAQSRASEGLQDFRRSALEVVQAANPLSAVRTGHDEQQLKLAVICLLNQFNLVYRNTPLVGRSVEENSFLLLQVLQAIQTTLTSSPSIATFVVENAAGNLAFLQAIVHIALGPALLAVGANSSNGARRPATFKDLLAMGPGQGALQRLSGGVLPLDFTSLSSADGAPGDGMPSIVVTAIELFAVPARRILLQLMTAQASQMGRSVAELRLRRTLLAVLVESCALNIGGMAWLTDLVRGPAAAGERLFSAQLGTTPAVQGTHVALLCGLLASPGATADDKVELLRLLNAVAEALSAEAQGGRLVTERIGLENEAAFVDALVTCLLDGTRTVEYFHPTVRGAAIEFLLILVHQQPTALCALFTAKRSTDSTAAGGESALAVALLKVLSNAEDLYNNDPRGLHLLYDLIFALCKSTQYLTLVKAALMMIQSKKFWDYVTVPLMLDVPPLPNATADMKPCTERLLHRSNGAKTPLEALDRNVADWTGAVGNNVAALEEEVALHSLRLHCHASALALLSIERYGVFYELDAAVATQVTKKLQAFYVKATESHRFISWIKHYLLITIDAGVHDDLRRLAGSLNVNLDEAAVGEYAPAEYGLNYRYDLKRVDGCIRAAHRDAVADDLAAREGSQVNLYLLGSLKVAVQQYNLCTSLSDASLELIRAWRQFLEFYVLPGSAAKLQQSKERSGSEGSGGGAGRSRKHSFDGESLEEGSSASPQQVGTLSPLTSAQSHASPLAGKKSSFTGDKRSYEVVTEIMLQLECHRGDGCMRSVLGRTAIAEKCELLVSMLHHQLKAVAARTSDPSKSVTVSRDLGSMRLTQDKMEKLLEKLDDFYRDLVFALNPGDGVGADDAEGELLQHLKNTIALRLLTSMMLLLNSIFAFNSADEAHSKLTHRRRSIYLFAVTALRNLLTTHGVSVLSSTPGAAAPEDSSHAVDSAIEEAKAGNAGTATGADQVGSTARSHRLTTEQSVAQVCLQVLKLALPRSSAVPLISITDHTAWRTMLTDCGAAALLTQVLQQLATLTSVVPSWDHNYSLWNSNALEANSKGGAEIGPVRSVQRPVDPSSYEEHRCMIMSLLCALDALISAVSANIISLRNTADVAAVLAALTNAPLLRGYQQVVLQQTESVAAALMGYNAVTAEVSLVAACWTRAVNLVENIVIRFDDVDATGAMKAGTSTTRAGPPVVTGQDLSDGVCSFVSTYVDLLLLPMRPASHRYTIQQLGLMRTAGSLFAALNANLPAWKVSLPAIHAEVSSRSLMLLRVFGLLLWHGEDMETMEQQRRLLAHCTAVSPAEKREGRVTHSGYGVLLLLVYHRFTMLLTELHALIIIQAQDASPQRLLWFPRTRRAHPRPARHFRGDYRVGEQHHEVGRPAWRHGERGRHDYSDHQGPQASGLLQLAACPPPWRWRGGRCGRQ